MPRKVAKTVKEEPKEDEDAPEGIVSYLDSFLISALRPLPLGAAAPLTLCLPRAQA